MKLTKEAVKRLNEGDVSVKLWNGCFNRAKVEAKFSRHSFELTVDVTHPALTWQCGDKREVQLVLWQGHTGSFVDLPDELQSLVEKMRVAATMTDAEATKLSHENRQSFAKAMRELGVTA